ncbi:tetratricopeptide repeat protein [Vibrio sp. Of14-4]|uniref:CDC27 family protein n=1 Tax=Vibrio sp. Of14-4 TaxID=2724878 RepID=UPI001EF30A21|nr:CDC27 family protein [Vibrio sp. Of14-4]MCG7488597.1 tetratricopeptide repeat protein [Vibrio sp. Of14-4]
MRKIRLIKIIIIVISLFTTPVLDTVKDSTTFIASSLSESTHFRTFPYLNRAFSFERSQRFVEAITEVKRALNIAPNYQPFLHYLFKLQLKAKTYTEAEQTLEALPEQEKVKLLASLRSEMSVQQLNLPNVEFVALLGDLPPEAKRQVYLYRLYWLADNSESLALDWSISQASDIKPDQAILYESEVWLKRENYLKVIDTMSQIRRRRALSDREQYIVGLALIKSKKIKETRELLTDADHGETKILLTKQLILDLIDDQEYDQALYWYQWLEQDYGLSSDDYERAFQLAISLGNWPLARAYQTKRSNASCTESALISARLGNRELAKQQLSSCSSFESPKLWLSLAEELNLSFMIEAASFDDSGLLHRQKIVVAWNRYHQGEYQKVIDILSSTAYLSLSSRRLLALAYEKNGQFNHSMLAWEAVYRRSNRQSDLKSLLEAMKKALTEVELIRQYEKLLSVSYLPSKVRLDIAEQLLTLYSKHPGKFAPEIAMQMKNLDIASFDNALLWQQYDGCNLAKKAFSNPQTSFAWQVLGYCSYPANVDRALEYTDNALLMQKSFSARLAIVGTKAQMLYQQQRYQEVLNVLLPEWQHIQSPYVRLLVASSYYQLKRYEKARFWWAESDDQDILDWWLLGTDIYLAKKDFTSAESNLEMVENKFESDRQIVSRYIRLYKLQGSKQKLTDYLSYQHKLHPQDVYIATELAYAYFLNRPKDSVRLFESVIPQLNGQDKISARHQLAQAYKNIGCGDKAQHEYKVLIDQLTTMPEKDTRLIDQLRAENRAVTSAWQFSFSGESGNSSPFQGLFDDPDSEGFYQVSASYGFESLPSLAGQVSVLSSGSWDSTGVDLGLKWRPLQRFDMTFSSGVRHYLGEDSYTTTYVRVNGDVFSGLGWDKTWRGVQQVSWSNSLYFDAFYQFYDQRSLLYTRGESGPVWGLAQNYHQRLRVYGLLQASADIVDEQSDNQVKTGAGVGWLASFNNDKYTGYSNETEISLEWQKYLSDSEKNAVILRFNLSY